MRKLLCALLVLVLFAVPVLLSVSAESAVDEDVLLSDLIPSDDTQIAAQDCEVTFNRDGSMTVRITGAAPTLKVTLAEGATLYTGAAVDLSDTANNPAYVAVDFGVAGNVLFDHMILHYTRKDKTAQNTVADLYLNSMFSADYVQYRKQASEAGYTAGTALVNGSNYYVVWDWGTYISGGDGKLNDDGRHHFTDIDVSFTGSTIGSEITFYTIAVVSDPEVELGTVAPDPIEDPSEDEPSEDEPSEDEPSEDEPEESSAEPAESSEEAPSAAASSVATSSAATSSTAADASSVASTSSEAESGGLGTGAIVGIIVAVVAVIAVVVVVVVKKKK